MLPKVRAMLDQIDSMLIKKDRAAGDLAAILSALRGPDENSFAADFAKGISTGPIRSIAFPELYYRNANGDLWLDPAETRCWGMMPSYRLDPSNKDIKHNQHFAQHIQLAVDAINRTSEEV